MFEAILLAWAVAASFASVVFFAQWRRSKRRFKHVTMNDELTGLLNRHGFWDQVERFIKVTVSAKVGAQRASFVVKDFSLIVFDIDRFKELNDMFGHRCGDAVLRRVAETVTSAIREVDLACRWGGEEIVVGLVGAGQQKALEIAERVRETVEKSPIMWDSGDIVRFTVSGGVSSVNGAKNFDELLEMADKALYLAKAGGRNRIVAYESSSTKPGR